MMTTFEPLEDRVLVRRDEHPEKQGEIYLPKYMLDRNPPQIGIVLAVGAGKWHDGDHIAPLIKVGDQILFGRYSGTEIKLNNERLTVLREGDILGIVHEGLPF